jgi:phosphoglycerate dehydrogenase-like enzyme
MNEVKVGILDDFQKVVRKLADWGRLPPHVEVSVFNDHVEGEELVRRLLPFHVLVLTRERTPLPRALIERLPNLKLVITAGMRNLGIDLAACRERGIPVCGTDSGSTPTAELAWGLILALARRIPHEDRALREGQWQTDVTGFSLRGKVLGILGLGRLGREMARVGQAFGMKTIAWSQNLTKEAAAESGCTRVEKEELFRQSDILTVHLLMSERSRGIVGRGEMAAMKPSSIIVNTSRAAIVDEAALIEALHAGKIAGAGLDVYNREPLPMDAPILRAPNTVLTPHLGYAVRESFDIYYREALEDIEAWLKGAPVRVISG